MLQSGGGLLAAGTMPAAILLADEVSLQSGGGLLAAGTRRLLAVAQLDRLASIWRRPLGRRDRSIMEDNPWTHFTLQSGGGLLAAGTSVPVLKIAQLAELQSGGGLLAAGTPAGHGESDQRQLASIWRRPLGRRDMRFTSTRTAKPSSFNLAAASWPPGHGERGTFQLKTYALQSGGGLLAAGTRVRHNANRQFTLLQSGGGLLAAGTRAVPRVCMDELELQSGGGLLAAGT